MLQSSGCFEKFLHFSDIEGVQINLLMQGAAIVLPRRSLATLTPNKFVFFYYWHHINNP